MTPGQLIRAARVGRGTSMRTLAALLEVTQPYLSEVENDKRRPSRARYEQIAIVLDLGLRTLLVADASFYGDFSRLPFYQDRADHVVAAAFEVT